MESLISNLKAKNPDLKEVEISGLLFLLREKSDLSDADLVKITGLPKETIKFFLASVNLSDAALQDLDLKPHKWSIFQYSGAEFEELVEKFSKFVKNSNLSPKREFDQFFATPETSVAKALILKDKGMLAGKKIALLGDDDLVSVVLGALGLIDGTSSITVFDIDQDVLASIKGISDSLGIKNVRTTVGTDVRRSLKPEYFGKFDVVITDPPYTKSGISLFINRAVQLLGQSKDFSGKYLFLYYGNSFKSPEKTLKVQDILNKFNLLIEDKINKFARYNGAESIGSASSLYILKTTPFTKPLDEAAFPENIYTHQNQKEEKFPYVSHYVFKVFGVPQNIISSKASMLKNLGRFCELHKLKVVDQKTTSFKGNGFTFAFILGNSNLLVHTWPEHNALHIDLITCVPLYNREMIGGNLVDLFKAKGIEVREVE